MFLMLLSGNSAICLKEGCIKQVIEFKVYHLRVYHERHYQGSLQKKEPICFHYYLTPRTEREQQTIAVTFSYIIFVREFEHKACGFACAGT